MMDKFKNLDPHARKMVSLTITLLVVVILSLAALYYTSGSGGDGATTVEPQVQQVDPAFNTEALDKVRGTNADRPSLGGSIGNPNPFSNF